MNDSRRWLPSWRALDHDPASITRQRHRRGWSQRQLAAEVGISRSYMCEIENGTRNAHPALLLKIARALQCTATSLQPKRRKGGMAA